VNDRVSLSDRARSGHGTDTRGGLLHLAGDGLRPVRAGCGLALGFWPEGVQRLRCSKGGSRRCFLRSDFRKDLRVPLDGGGATPDTKRAMPGSEPGPFSLHLSGIAGAGQCASRQRGAPALLMRPFQERRWPRRPVGVEAPGATGAPRSAGSGGAAAPGGRRGLRVRP
jgi:hypothetical protein